MIPVPTTEDQVKIIAKQLLSETDYTQLPDVNISNKQQFAAYRQYLRNYYDNPFPILPFTEPPKTQWIEE
jgi:hypothetical protein